jgi:hypothetical protein
LVRGLRHRHRRRQQRRHQNPSCDDDEVDEQGEDEVDDEGEKANDEEQDGGVYVGTAFLKISNGQSTVLIFRESEC